MNKSILAIDIGTTNITAIVATNDFNNKINILGVGNTKSEGVQKGNIIDINLAGLSIKEAVSNAINSAGSTTHDVIVSLSGANTRTLRSNGSINIPSGIITKNEIKQVLKMALYNAQIIPDYDVIHVLPIFFRVDDGSTISNPLNMNGSRLEVSVNLITAKKTSLTNVKNALKQANLEVDKFVLAGYANAIATLEDDQKKLGSVVINLGGTTTQLVVYKGTTIIYNDFLPIGSEHITRDISVMLHTPYSAANMIKNKYASLLPIEENENEPNIRKVKLPILGNEVESKEISIDQIQPILHARIEEILTTINDKLIESSILENIDGGVVLTGGMTYIPGVKELANLVFKNIPVKVSNPKNIQNGYIDFNNPTMTTIVGLLLYELNNENSFELDSNSELRRSDELVNHSAKTVNNSSQNNNNNSFNDDNFNKQDTKIPTISTPSEIKDLAIEKDKKQEPKKLSKFMSIISRWL
ncbi:MAG: cell division protein FtsA [Campylobacterota bacterium]|nr:cell division protein FtsA [Campylobacterota bacterium]